MSSDEDFMGGPSPSSNTVSINSVALINICPIQINLIKQLILSILEIEGLVLSTVTETAIPNLSKKALKKQLVNKHASRDLYIFLIDFAGSDLTNKLQILIESLALPDSKFLLCFRFTEHDDPFILPHVFVRNTINLPKLLNWFTQNSHLNKSILPIAEDRFGEYMTSFMTILEFCSVLPSNCSHVYKHVI